MPTLARTRYLSEGLVVSSCLSPWLMAFCTGCAETCMQWWTVSGAAAVLQYALDLQLQVNSSWEEEVRQPRWQPWRSLTCLLSAQEAIPEAHKALLLQFILASPSPCEVSSHTCTSSTSQLLQHHLCCKQPTGLCESTRAWSGGVRAQEAY